MDRRFLILLFVVAAGCPSKTPNPLFCDEETPCPDGQVCDLDGEISGIGNHCVAGDCEGPQDCVSSAPICDLELGEGSLGECRGCDGDDECVALDTGLEVCESGACVECRDSADCDEGSNRPVCETSRGECRACAEHDECGSLVCDRETGGCVAEADVIYADAESGADGADCGTRASPCQTLGASDEDGALAKLETGRSVVKLLGADDFAESVALDGVTVRLVGPGTVNPPADDEPALLVDGGSELGVDEVTLTGAVGNADADGLRCAGGSTVSLFRATVSNNDATGIQGDNCTVTLEGSEVSGNQGVGIDASGGTLTLSGSEVSGNQGVGIDASGGTLTVEGSEVSGNQGVGIDASGGTLTVEGSEVSGNQDGGLSVTDSEFRILNTFITGNGRAGAGGSVFGGVQLGTTAGTDDFSFNTLSDNLAATGALGRGMNCLVATQMTASGNIVHDGGGAPLVTANCELEYSNIQGGPAGTDNNIDEDPLFVNPAEGDFHIRPGSPCIDAADPASEVDVDFDGDARPAGDAPDIGADEVP